MECENVENSVRAPAEEKYDEANFFISKMAVAMCNQNTCCKKRGEYLRFFVVPFPQQNNHSKLHVSPSSELDLCYLFNPSVLQVLEW